MRTVQVEHLRPGEIAEEKSKHSIIYLPFGPIEWHNPANPYGTDALLAHAVACRAAEQTGGVVFPVCCLGSDCPRPEVHLEKLGFSDTKQYIVGMDFPNNFLKSFYFPVEIVALVVREHVRVCIEQGYKLIVVFSGHGAATQNILIDEICKDFSENSKSMVINGFGAAMKKGSPSSEQNTIVGHANISETSMMCYLHGGDVDLDALPTDRNVKLRYQDYGIVDRSVLFGGLKGDGTVINDPRDANYELGKELIDGMISNIVEYVNQEFSKLR